VGVLRLLILKKNTKISHVFRICAAVSHKDIRNSKIISLHLHLYMSNGYFGSTIHELAVFYNTENFYSAEARTSQLPNIEFSGLRNWDQFRFQNKLQKIAQVFQLINEKHGVMPMLIGLAEVQGEGVLQHLVSQPVFEGRFNVIHYESMDERGVDVALIYDKSKVEVISSEP